MGGIWGAGLDSQWGCPCWVGWGVSHRGLPPLLSPGKCPKPLKNRDVITLRSWLPMGTDYIIMNYSVKHPVSPRGGWGGQPGVLPAPGQGWVCPMVGGRSGWRHWGAVGGVRAALPAVSACLYPILPLPSMHPCPPAILTVPPAELPPSEGHGASGLHPDGLPDRGDGSQELHHHLPGTGGPQR